MVFKATKHSLHCTWSRLTVEEGEKKLSHWVTAELIKKSQTDKKGNLCIFKHLKFKSSNVWGKNGVKKSHLFNTKQYCVRKYKQNKKTTAVYLLISRANLLFLKNFRYTSPISQVMGLHSLCHKSMPIYFCHYLHWLRDVILTDIWLRNNFRISIQMD